MSAFSDNWAVTPATNDELLFASAAIGAAGAVTLLRSNTGYNGEGYKIRFTSAGNSSGMTYTIVGHKMGTAPGVSTTEVVTGPNATTGDSTNYYDSITSITASAAATGNQKIGILGTSVMLPRTRVKGVYYVSTASAGSIAVNLNSTSGRLLLKIDTPAGVTVTNYVYMANGILVGGGAAATDVGLVTLTNVTYCTLICG